MSQALGTPAAQPAQATTRGAQGRPQLRIGIDARPALWPRTGIGTITRGVVAQMRNTGPDCACFAYFDAAPGEMAAGLGPIRCAFGGPRQKLLWSNTWLPRQLLRDRIDVLVTFLDKEVPLLPTRARIVCMVHDLIPLRFPGMFRGVAHRLYYSALIRAAVRRADAVLTNSEFSRREITGVLRVDAGKIHRITLGADRLQPIRIEQADEVAARFRLSRPYVIAQGSTEPRKNNQRAIEAMRLLWPRYPQLKLAIAGAPWRGRSFDPASLDERIVELGHISDADLRDLMSGAAMLVFPSLHEGFGLPVLEAMALGIPVVTSNLTALPEVGGDAVLYANPINAAEIAAQMERVLSDPELTETLLTRGRARAERFNWETTCAEITTLCAQLMENRGWQHQPAMR